MKIPIHLACKRDKKKKKIEIKLAALLLTCDLVNPYHERKEQKEKKEKKHKKGLCERSGGTVTSRERGETE